MKRAFTLLELLVVVCILVLIIGLLIAVVVKGRRAAENLKNRVLLTDPINKALIRPYKGKAGSLTPKQYQEARDHLKMQMKVIEDRK